VSAYIRQFAALVVTAVLLAGCAGADGLLHNSARPHSRAAREYLAQLVVEQHKLAAAELRLPVHPRTRAALAHSIRLLAGAIKRFGSGLAAVKPLASVATLHRRLVAIAANYRGQLLALAPRTSRAPSAIAAANALVADTTATSREFTATVVAIRSKLDH
jgi:hypothetical protein